MQTYKMMILRDWLLIGLSFFGFITSYDRSIPTGHRQLLAQ